MWSKLWKWILANVLPSLISTAATKAAEEVAKKGEKK